MVVVLDDLFGLPVTSGGVGALEGIATLFVFGHVSSRLAPIKSSCLRFQFCANAAINPRFLVGEGFNSRCG